MLVAISGSQGSGKSTILRQLSEQGLQTVERKTSRSILNDWNVTLDQINSDYDLTIKFQEEILKRKISDETRAKRSDELWFTERTYADLFTYALITLGKENKYADWIDDYYIRCMQLQQNYDLVFYLKAGHFSIEHDGVRGSSCHYSRMSDMIMFDITQQMTHNSRTSIIDTPMLQHRVNMITIQTNALLK